jgi:hypothetical protein
VEMISVGLWVAGWFGKTPAAATAKKIGAVVCIVGGLLATVALIFAGIRMHDAGVVEQHVQVQEATVAKKTLAADRAANDALANRTQQVEAENAVLVNAITEAKAADPEKGKRTVGRVQQSYFDHLPVKGK